MIFETKYNIGDEVFAIQYGKICKFPIEAIRITHKIEEKCYIKPYKWTYIEYLVNGEWLIESELFATKEELINSL